MIEIWVYGVSAAADKVYFAVWGSGLLEYNQKTGAWDKYEDPDGETEIVVFKDQGLIHEITCRSVMWMRLCGCRRTSATATTTAATGITS